MLTNHRLAILKSLFAYFTYAISRLSLSVLRAGFKKTLHRGLGRGIRSSASAPSKVAGVSVVSDDHGVNGLQLPLHQLSQSCFAPISLGSGSNARSMGNVTVTNPGAYQRKRSISSQDVCNNNPVGLRLNVAPNLL